MRLSTRVVLSLSVLLILVGVLWALKPHPAATPELQIVQSLHEAEDAARRGNVNELMDFVSSDFKAGVLNHDRLRLLLMRSRSLARGTDYDVRVTQPTILPANPATPDERTVMSRFAVFDALGGDTYWQADGLTLVMRKESRRRYLIFSEPVWRVVSVVNLPPLPGLGGE